MLPIECIDYGSERYQQLLALRQSMLRAPLGLEFTPAQLAADAVDTHFVMLEDDMVIGGLILARLDESRAKLRQMVIRKEHQDIGLGAKLIQHVHHYARREGFMRTLLHARETAIPFYEKQGYRVMGEPFIEITLPHRRMERALD